MLFAVKTGHFLGAFSFRPPKRNRKKIGSPTFLTTGYLKTILRFLDMLIVHVMHCLYGAIILQIQRLKGSKGRMVAVSRGFCKALWKRK